MKENVFSLNLGGTLLSLDRPRVMGILNLTPDSFYQGSRFQDSGLIGERTRQMIREGASIIDVGACSTRPGSHSVDEKEELDRLCRGLEAVRQEAPDFPLSVDTFRASVARVALRDFGCCMVNDISSGQMDSEMFETVACHGAAYVANHMRGTPEDCQQDCVYEDLMADLLSFFFPKVRRLHQMGVRDIILDPGIGFSKTVEQNFRVLSRLGDLRLMGLPLLVGISRKSLICKTLEVPPERALNGTTALHMAALERGAHLLRVHDVAQAVETVKLYLALRNQGGEQPFPPSPLI